MKKIEAKRARERAFKLAKELNSAAELAAELVVALNDTAKAAVRFGEELEDEDSALKES